MGNTIKNVLDTILELLDAIPVVGPIIAAIIKAIYAVIVFVFDFFGFIRNIFRRISERIKGFIDNLKERLERLKQFLKNVIGSLTALVTGIFNFLGIILRSLFATLTIFFHGFVVFPLYSTKRFLNDALQEGYGRPLTKARREFDNFMKYLALFLEELRGSLKQLFNNLLISLAFIGATLLAGIFVFAFLYFLSTNPTFAIKVIIAILRGISAVGDFLISALNGISNTLSLIAPTIINAINSIVPVAKLILGYLCNPDLVFTGDLNTDCPPIVSFFQFIEMSLNLIFAIFQLVFQFLQLIGTIIAAIICPGGVCSIETCTLYSTTPICNFDVFMAINWFFTTLIEILKFIFPIARAILYFFIDVCAFLSLAFSSIAQAFSKDNDGSFLGNFVRAQIATVTCNAGVCTNYKSLLLGLKQDGFVKFLLFVESFSSYLLTFIIYTIRDWFVLIDVFVCWIIKFFVKCTVTQTCRILLPDFCAVPLFAAVTDCAIYIQLSQICAFIGLNINNCPCNQCRYTFTEPIVSFFLNYVGSDAFVPCNPSSTLCPACSPDYSILSGFKIFSGF